ncbi:M20 family metallopeptidase [Elioraea sp.]|uniref:M20 family metallopeptidase n=1 Tax=Elioraea sp. TaxID=2185103 RepID=UPI0025C301FB|nr:M20 family metallopeptidase [Elioraea sp.]
MSVTDTLARLVAYDTQNPGPGEGECAPWIAGRLAALGAEVTIDGFAPGRPNVIGRIANGPGPVFAFNTHMDVVPAGEGWSGDAFTLRERDGHLVGRGACDAKGSLAAMLHAMEALAADRATWSGTLLGVFVADEEVSSRGAKHLASTRPGIDFVVVGEPSGNAPIIAHKGSLRPRVVVRGRTAHSGTPDLGLNAIYQAGLLLPRIAALHARLRDIVHPLVGSPSLTVTRAEAGIADNIVPDRCALLLDRRLVPGETEGDAVAVIEAMLAEAAADGITAAIEALVPTTGGPAETKPDHPIVAAALVAAARHGVADPTPAGFQGACDFVHFRNIGAEGVVLGPGDLAVAHKPDEFVPRAALEAAVGIYADIARAMLAR